MKRSCSNDAAGPFFMPGRDGDGMNGHTRLNNLIEFVSWNLFCACPYVTGRSESGSVDTLYIGMADKSALGVRSLA